MTSLQAITPSDKQDARRASAPLHASPPAGSDEGGLSSAAAAVWRTFSPTGLTIPPALALLEWAELVVMIGQVTDGCRWAAGDLLLAIDRNEYPEEHSQFLDQFKLAPETLANYKSLARKFPRHRRHPALSLSHHDTVAKLPPEEQDRWLALAERHDWRRDEFRAQVRISREMGTLASRSLPLAGTAETTGKGTVALLTGELVDSWHGLPADDDLPLDGWPEYDGPAPGLRTGAQELSSERGVQCPYCGGRFNSWTQATEVEQ